MTKNTQNKETPKPEYPVNKNKRGSTSNKGRRNNRGKGGEQQQVGSTGSASKSANSGNIKGGVTQTPSIVDYLDNISTQYYYGAEIPGTKYSTAGGNTFELNHARAIGFVVYPYIPTFGDVSRAESSFNTLIKRIYSRLFFQKGSSVSTYEAEDIGRYIISVDSVNILAAYIQSIFAIANMFTSDSAYVPDDLLHSIGLTGETMSHIAETQVTLATRVNFALMRFNTMYNPSALVPFTQLHMSMAGHISTDRDDDTLRKLLYVTVPAGFYNYDFNSASCKFIKTFGSNNYTTLDSLVSLLEMLVYDIWSDEDFKIMSGDMAYTFGVNTSMATAPVDISFVVRPTYEPDFLMAMRNTICLPQEVLNVNTSTNTWLNFVSNNSVLAYDDPWRLAVKSAPSSAAYTAVEIALATLFNTPFMVTKPGVFQPGDIAKLVQFNPVIRDLVIEHSTSTLAISANVACGPVAFITPTVCNKTANNSLNKYVMDWSWTIGAGASGNSVTVNTGTITNLWTANFPNIYMNVEYLPRMTGIHVEFAAQDWTTPTYMNLTDSIDIDTYALVQVETVRLMNANLILNAINLLA